MKHPTLSRDAAFRIASERIVAAVQADDAVSVNSLRPQDLVADLSGIVQWWGEEPEMDTAPLDQMTREIRELVDSHDYETADADQTEGRAACALYRALEQADPDAAALNHPGFWRYVGLACTWDLTVWREPRAFSVREAEDGSKEATASFRPYIDGRECVPLRMYLRVKSLGGLRHESLAWAVREGTDFWRSHILRVKAGEHPSIVRAMVKRQADEATRLTTDPLRRFAKDLRRTTTNLVPALLNDDDADALVGELWDRSMLS